ncbi:hypothetical protein AB0A71_38930 [Kitasatospora aureofaciens]|uniref:zinc finger domain-containing protein n=1 Tax=Kitasatospora aureofaciens TaxID=1894 RepID=UPI0033F40182
MAITNKERAERALQREAARLKTCTHCWAAAGEHCKPGPGGRSNTHRERLDFALRDHAPLPARELIPRDSAWIYQPLNVSDPDSPILGIRQSIFRTLCRDTDEMGALTVVAISQYDPEYPTLNNPMVLMAAQMFLGLSEEERETAIARLLARGYLNVSGPRAVQTAPDAARVFEVPEMDAAFMSRWAAAKKAVPQPRI